MERQAKTKRNSHCAPAEMLCDQLPGWIDHRPHDRGAQQQIKHDRELVVSRHQCLVRQRYKKHIQRKPAERTDTAIKLNFTPDWNTPMARAVPIMATNAAAVRCRVARSLPRATM